MPAKRKSKSKRGTTKKTKNQKTHVTVNVNSHNRRKSSVVKQGGGGGGNIPLFHSVQPAAPPQVIFLQQPEQPRQHIAPPVYLPIIDDIRQQRQQQETRNPIRNEEQQEQILHARLQEDIRKRRLQRFETALNMQRKNDETNIATGRGGSLDGRDILDTDAMIPAANDDSDSSQNRWTEPVTAAARARGTIINPVTGRRITIGGSVYNKLVNEGKIVADKNQKKL
jgi:hypothetical protein